MSIVLYALGGCLIVWSGFMLLSGETFATIDIAANLAGWGAFAIGLGAVTAALNRLTKALAAGNGATRRASATAPRDVRRQEKDVGPVLAPRERDPSGLEPQPASEPSMAPRLDVPSAPKRRQEPSVEPAPERREARAGVIVLRPADRDEKRGKPTELTKQERRARRLHAQQGAVEAPVVAAPAIGGGLATKSAAPAPEPAAAATPSVKDAIEMTPAASAAATPPPAEAPSTAGEASLAAKSEPAAAAAPDDAAVPTDEAPADDARPAVVDRDQAAAPVSLEVRLSRPDPKVPEWLARARARREARAASIAPEVALPSEPALAQERFVDPEPGFDAASEPQIALEREVAPKSEPEPEAQDGAGRQAEPRYGIGSDSEAPEAAPFENEPSPTATVEHVSATIEAATAGPQVVREGEHKGVLYRFYDDASVEAISSFGVRRFASVEDLRATVVAAKGVEDGEVSEEVSEEASPSPVPAPLESAQLPEADPLDAALAELERGAAAAPELRIDPHDRPGRP